MATGSATPLLDQPTATTPLTPQAPASLIKIAASDAAISNIEGIAKECFSIFGVNMSEMRRTLMMANAVKQLRTLLTDEIMAEIMELEGTTIGYRTDRDSKPDSEKYTTAETRNCIIECLIRGGRFTGNEMNIIASRYYATKEFFTRALREFPGFSNFKFQIGAPVINGDRALCTAEASWRFKGVPDSISWSVTKLEGTSHVLDGRISVKVNAKMGDDAFRGKAEKKLKQAIFTRLTGSKFEDEDGDESNVIEAVPAPAKIEANETVGKPQADETNQESEFRDEFLNEVSEKFNSFDNHKKVLEYKGQALRQCLTKIERQRVIDLAAAQLERFKSQS